MIPLVLVHPSGYTHEIFAAQTAAFPQADAVSLPGHPEGDPLATVGEMADWLERDLRWRGGEPSAIGGNSLGGAVALEFALRYPAQTAALLLIGTGARLRVSAGIFDMIATKWPHCVPALVDYSLGPEPPAGMRERAEAMHLAVGPASTRADFQACNEFDVRDRLAEITAPTLIVVGELDEMTPVKYSQYLHEHIAGSELLVVPRAGHLVMAEKPDVVNAAIDRFLKKI